MNSLYSCSWIQNVKPLTEQEWVSKATHYLVTEASGRVSDPRYARLMGLQSVKDLQGQFVPRYFATKVIRQLEKDHPGVPIDQISDADLEAAMQIVSNLSRKLSVNSGPKFTATKASSIPGPETELQKGKSGFDTLNMNLPPETILTFKEESPLGLAVYTAKKGRLNFRVSLKDIGEDKIPLSSLTPDQVSSLVVTQSDKNETISAPTLNNMDAPKVDREKLVADYPPGGEGDWSGKETDPEDAAYGKKDEDDEYGEVDTKEDEPIEDSGDEDEDEKAKPSKKKSKDEDEQKKAIASVSNPIDSSGLVIGTALTDDDEKDKLNHTFNKKRLKAIAKNNYGYKRSPKEEANEEQVRLTPQEINRRLQTAHREKQQYYARVDRLNGVGY